MKICVVGLGYIGLPTSAMFASHGCEVVGVDITPSVVETLNKGHIHIEEPGLEEVIKNNVKDGTFHASLEPEKADVFIISVPTPNNNDENLSCDLTYVLKATESIMPYVENGNVIIIESTIAPRSTEDYIKPIFEKAGFKVGKDIYLAHCPERVLPGQILFELKHNNRIVGGITSECTEFAAKVYETFVEGEIIKTEAKTAELSKCMENTFRDVNIALANELTKICYKLDINVLDVINMANKHPRVNLHYPGPGVGGHCLAIDPYFVAAKAPDIAKIIRLSRDTNCSMPEFVVGKVEMLVKNINNPKIAIFGITYKGNVDDVRESPAIEVVQKLKSKGYNIEINDPHVNNLEYVSMHEAVSGADLIVVLADHNEYKEFNHREVAQEMRRPLLFDTKAFIKEQNNSNLDIVNFGSLYKYKK
ncbi:nucleotide sugar dehydrogenase [Clostridium botulinum]|uniref:nucleotide sugar dehydrogenase n=1 Tax=unclassified Clostridium TaxID=2614128 RepID=UPI0005008A73|nr:MULTISPECIES: nucleotide sugar dehydrogenase [unclassified Clostridium]AIY78964.1 UDP-N-acetyl-D-mannosamine dehydrogenase [Clostridium botulinum 202F]KAI3347509.1 nucleotide sugar dehydrogenase [Clostridium botulinum]KFX56728.1 UDP-N-acetyl-D-mannosamine dehydrogenase [Clostridium botulinum]KFX59694.1 UDP-N-acetyl-D-mannosamine dehydrogenase [Clostridium botulinum]KON14268.1 UDP-N-acetyl-D-mannosamine dehydrogenase [Clostridium botulinum]